MDRAAVRVDDVICRRGYVCADRRPVLAGGASRACSRGVERVCSCLRWSKCDALEAVFRIVRVLPVFLLLVGSFVPLRMIGQIAPLPYTSVPAAAVDNAPQVRAGASPLDAPKAFIRGWSFGSELDQSAIRQGEQVSLDPGHPEIILFFDARGAPELPVEFRYRLDDYDADWTATMSRVAHYRKLTPGDYRFEVQARTPGQPWPSEVALLLVNRGHSSTKPGTST